MSKDLPNSEEITVPDSHKFFNLQRIVSSTGIQQDKIYNNMKGHYDSLSAEEKKRIATVLMIPIRDMFKRLGMGVKFHKLGPNGGE